MAAHNTSNKPHAIIVAIPLQGHLRPAVDIAVKLATKGFVVTFVNAESKHQRISKLNTNTNGSEYTDIFAEARYKGLDIRYELVTASMPESFDMSLYVYDVGQLFVKYIPLHVEKLLQRFVLEGCDRITCLMTDTYYTWPATMAKKFGIPFVSFWTQPATAFSLLYHAQLLINNGQFDCQVKDRVTITYIPGIPSIEPNDLVSFLQEPNVSTQNHIEIFKAFDETKNAEFVLSNSVQELESQCTEALQKEQRFFTIGPIIRDDFTSSITINTSLWPENDCEKWLDKQPQASVLYISFGSLFRPNKRDLQEIIHGSLGSKAKFLFASPPGSEKFDELFDELLKENEGRGLIVRWCNQKQVLKHHAIGGFLTHCGWNSILESIWCEVPMLCFPLFTDQFTNRKLVVKDWKIGIDIGPINEVKRHQVCKLIDGLIGGSEIGVDLRKNIKQVKQVIVNALSPNGSSTKNFDQFVEELLMLE